MPRNRDQMRMSRAPSPRQLQVLRVTLLAVGAAWTAFFVAFIPIVLFDPVDHHSLAGRLLLWGHGGEEYLAMITAMNLVIGVSLLRAAQAPRAHAETIDLCLAINVAHMATMLLMALAGRHHHQHLAGDVALGIISTVALAVAWLPVRGPLRTTTTSVGQGQQHGVASGPVRAAGPDS